MAADLSTTFTGLPFRNPFLLSSAPPTESESNILRAFEAGWGGVVTKTIGLHPVVNVSVAAAEAYTRWLGRRLGRPLRLPTVDEWREAAHAGRADPDWLKDDLERGRVNYRRTEWELSAVGEFAANPYGIVDLLGNAHDTCRLGAEVGVVACGGAFWATKAQLQDVQPLDDFECRRDVGFRCAGDLTPADDEPVPGLGGDRDA